MIHSLEPSNQASKPQPARLRLVFDGGCPFCRSFAELSELRGGLPRLEIVDGRADDRLRQELKAQGCPLSRGAVLMVELDGDTRLFHGPAAVARLCHQLRPSPGLLGLLKMVFASRERTERLYPLLLAARHLALDWRGLPLDPDADADAASEPHQPQQPQR